MSDFRTACAAQVLRLHGHKGYPLTRERLKDLVDALEWTGSEMVATTVMNEVIDGLSREDWIPSAGELRRMADKARLIESTCEKCDGTGWRQIEDIFTIHSKGVRPCECRKAVPA